MSPNAWCAMPADAVIHDPVLAHEVVALLDVSPGACFELRLPRP